MEMQDYFRPHKGYFWQWEDRGEVLSITGGNTIAYRQYVLDLLEHLSHNGLPPFGSVLLVLLATNANGKSDVAAVYALLNSLLGPANQSREPLTTAVTFLHLLADLPPKYKQGKSRLLVLQTLFADCHNRMSVTTSKSYLQSVRTAQVMGDGFLAPGAFFINLYHEDFTVIKLLARRFPDGKTLLEALAALPLVEEELPIEKAEGDKADEKDLVQSLIENNKTFHVGALVERLWSGLNIPHQASLPSRQPLGGVSGLTNKGDLHRLLVSEFANDDTVFLSRLANNEALYLNREVPPQKSETSRIVLIDVSIKNWGTPKTVAFALLLAIAKHPKTDIACSAYAVGDDVQPLKFDTVDDVIEGLQHLSAGLHPAQGLENFFKSLSAKKGTEIFFISSAETYRQPALHKVMSDHYPLFAYWLHTTADGGVDVYKRQQNSKRHVQHLQLPLEELWKKPEKAVRANAKVEAKFKATGGRREYPILFPAASNPRNTMVAENGDVYLITTEWSLLRSVHHPTEGHNNRWEMIYEGLPHFAGKAEMGVDESGRLLLFLFNQSNKKLTLLDVESNDSRSVRFHLSDEMDFDKLVFHKDAFLLPRRNAGGALRIILAEDVACQPASVPVGLMEEKLAAKQQAAARVHVPNLLLSTVFKNVTRVFINEVGNLVLNRQELRLTDSGWIMLQKTGFVKREVEALSAGRAGFRFADGSTVYVNKSGMLVLKSSDPSRQTVFVPSVVDSGLGVATETDFAGLTTYRKQSAAQVELSTKEFWKEHILPFIETIKNAGA